ncbi:MAG TPA: prepilin-type N-terminal cleavage/methylation domain-containing protein [Candidatus Polarisedimenticolaceae bacterium]|nr:prepilin-type N-terminal cleavage/methylation domain-containing protein [Candidatus Polarisedimenticolaceae bacterium]
MRARVAARGFTLIELMVVIAIIGILAAGAVGHYTRSIAKAKEATLKEDLYILRTAISLYFSDKGKYPAGLGTLVEARYLERLPLDPLTESSDTWIPVYAELDESDISTEPGIRFVRSGARGSALNGTPYSDW